MAVRDATVTLEGRTVLAGVSLTVPVGDVVAILGANGSGKSTLVRTALGLAPLSAGQAELFGTPVRRFRDWARVGYVPQRLGAGSGVPATVREVVAAGRLARRGWRPPSRTDRDAVVAALDAVGLGHRARDPVATLSGGQQQRTLIARALAGQPDLLVLDEPTAGVDAASILAFAAVLDRFVRARQGTVVLVAHELGPLQPLVSHAAVLHAGQVVYDGPADRLGEAAGGHVHAHAPVEDTIWGSR